jgi:hypothetical protein
MFQFQTISNNLLLKVNFLLLFSMQSLFLLSQESLFKYIPSIYYSASIDPKSNSHLIDIKNLPNGVYWVNFYDGNKFTNSKLIIEKP